MSSSKKLAQEGNVLRAGAVVGLLQGWRGSFVEGVVLGELGFAVRDTGATDYGAPRPVDHLLALASVTRVVRSNASD